LGDQTLAQFKMVIDYEVREIRVGGKKIETYGCRPGRQSKGANAALCRTTGDHVIPARSTKFISCRVRGDMKDGDMVMAEPCRTLIADGSLLIPRAIAKVHRGCVSIPVSNTQDDTVTIDRERRICLVSEVDEITEIISADRANDNALEIMIKNGGLSPYGKYGPMEDLINSGEMASRVAAVQTEPLNWNGVVTSTISAGSLSGSTNVVVRRRCLTASY
jgi:hypothetical protein